MSCGKIFTLNLNKQYSKCTPVHVVAGWYKGEFAKSGVYHNIALCNFDLSEDNNLVSLHYRYNNERGYIFQRNVEAWCKK